MQSAMRVVETLPAHVLMGVLPVVVVLLGQILA